MLLSILLFLILISITIYVHNYITENPNKPILTIRIPTFSNNKEIIIDTPIQTPDGFSTPSSNNDDLISMTSDNMSVISMDEQQELNCTNINPVEMPRGVDKYDLNNDNANHDFSNNKQMKVFDKHDFVKDIGNGRVNVNTTNNISLPSINEPSNVPEAFGLSYGYGQTMASYTNTSVNRTQENRCMSGVVPY